MHKLTLDPTDSEKNSSLAPPPYTSNNASGSTSRVSSSTTTAFASLSLHAADKLRLLQFPQSEIPAIRTVIQNSWHRGIQREQVYCGSQEFKLHGYPWSGQGSDAIPSRILMVNLLRHLYNSGWRLVVSTDCSKNSTDKDSLLFRRKEPSVSHGHEKKMVGFEESREEVDVLAISFNQSDRLRLIGAEESLIQSFRGLLKGMGRLQDEFWKDRPKCAYEFKIRGYSWTATGSETMATRMLLLNCLGTLESHGWCLYASIDQNTGSEGRDLDTWYCIRQKGWVSGMEVLG